MDLSLPGYDFFANGMQVDHEEPKKCRSGNAYTGSLGTDPQRGFVNQTSFCFSVLLWKDVEGTKRFVVRSWLRLPYSRKTECYESCHEENTFEGTADSLQAIREYLLARFDRLINQA